MMNQIKEYINQKKELQNLVLAFINDESGVNLTSIVDFNTKQKFDENPAELKAFLFLLLKISNNHHRSPNFFDKIDQIFSFYKEQIKQTYSNLEIFNFFKRNKRILLSLIKCNIIEFDQLITDILIEEVDPKYNKYQFYFYPEIKPFLSKEKIELIEKKCLEIDENFFNTIEKKRLRGENDSYISVMIQNDSIVDFISFVNQLNMNLSTIIKPSIFETNHFLLKSKEISLIEYASFYGSMNIIDFLLKNDVELTNSIWPFAIHSNNAELIQLLEEKLGKPNATLFEICLKESIRCHHNEIATYFIDNYIDEMYTKKFYNLNVLFSNFVDYSFHYYNYRLLPKKFKKDEIFYNFCIYGYFELVKNLINLDSLHAKKNFVFLFKFLNDISKI